MADRTPDTGERPPADRPPGAPRWVKAFGVVGIFLVLLVVVVLVFGGGPGGHGPGRHAPSGDAGGRVASSGVMEDHAPPEGGRG